MNAKETFGAEIAKQVPIKEVYHDLAHPVLSTLGQSLQGITRVALAPISALVWSYDKIAGHLDVAIPEYFAKRRISKEKIITPDPTIAVPVIEAMRYSSHKEELLKMFTDTLCSAMNADTADNTYPSFVEIIKQLTSDECKILHYIKHSPYLPLVKVNRKLADKKGDVEITPLFSNIGELAGCTQALSISAYLDNLQRLGIISIITDGRLTNEAVYEPLENHPYIVKSMQSPLIEGDSYEIQKKYFRITNYGKIFCNVCVNNDNEITILGEQP